MRPLFTFLLSLAVTFSAAGAGVELPCDCGCGNVEALCPCGHAKGNAGGDSEAPVSSAPTAPIIPSAPVNSDCSPHEPLNSPAVAPAAENQLEQKTNTTMAQGAGKAFVSLYGFDDSALQTQFAMRLDVLRGPPRQSSFIKTNTRLAALSTLRI